MSEIPTKFLERRKWRFNRFNSISRI